MSRVKVWVSRLYEERQSFEQTAETSALRRTLPFPKETSHSAMVSRAGYHGYGLLHAEVFTSLVLRPECTLGNKPVLQSLLSV